MYNTIFARIFHIFQSLYGIIMLYLNNIDRYIFLNVWIGILTVTQYLPHGREILNAVTGSEERTNDSCVCMPHIYSVYTY